MNAARIAKVTRLDLVSPANLEKSDAFPPLKWNKMGHCLQNTWGREAPPKAPSRRVAPCPRYNLAARASVRIALRLHMFCCYVTFYPILVAKNRQSFGGGFFAKNSGSGPGVAGGGSLRGAKIKRRTTYGRLTLPSGRAPAVKFEHMGHYRLAFGTFYNNEGRRASRGVTSDIYNR